MDFRLTIDRETVSGLIVLRMRGRLDAASAPDLEKKLSQEIAEGNHKIVLDFGGVDYSSSAGMRVLLSKTKELKELNGGLYCSSIGDDVMSIINLAGFQRIIIIHQTEKEAIQALLALNCS